MTINYIFRSEKTVFFSIERVFETVINRISKETEVNIVHVPEVNANIKSIVKNLLYCKKISRQKGIFHITGDVHYVALVLPKKRVVLTIHDLVMLNRLCGIKKVIFKTFWYTLPIMHCSKVTVISPKIYDDLCAMYPRYKEKISIVPNAVDDAFEYVPKEFDKDNPVVLQIGTTENKNIPRVALALKGINCRYRIVGKLSEELFRYLQENGVEYENVYALTAEQIVDEYRNADIVMFPSTYEGFGMPIVEGGATGRIVITSELSPMREVAGEGAILVNPYSVEDIREAVLMVISDDKTRKELIDEALQNVGNYRIQNVVHKYLECYDALEYAEECSS